MIDSELIKKSYLETWISKKLGNFYFQLKKPLDGKADIQKHTQKRPLYAAISLHLEPREKGFGLGTKIDLKFQDIEDSDQQKCIEASFQGAIDQLLTHHFHPILDVEIILTRFFYDKPQSAQVVFWLAGKEAIKNALHHQGGVGMTEDQERFELVSRF